MTEGNVNVDTSGDNINILFNCGNTKRNVTIAPPGFFPNMVLLKRSEYEKLISTTSTSTSIECSCNVWRNTSIILSILILCLLYKIQKSHI